MNEYNISDYEIFSSAIATTSNNVRLLVEALTTIQQEVSKLQNSDVFLGPLCDSALQEWQAINSKASDLLNGFNNISSYLNDVSASYAAADTTTGNEVGCEVI